MGRGGGARSTRTPRAIPTPSAMRKKPRHRHSYWRRVQFPTNNNHAGRSPGGRGGFSPGGRGGGRGTSRSDLINPIRAGRVRSSRRATRRNCRSAPVVFSGRRLRRRPSGALFAIEILRRAEDPPSPHQNLTW